MRTLEMKECCRRLRGRAPEEWEQFVLMFNQHTAEAVDQVTEADAATIMTAKGFAQAHKAWLRLFGTLDVPDKPPPSTPTEPNFSSLMG
jgi:hypothetical protein